MIARILYRESVHGVLNYVLEKKHSKILGFSNVASSMEEYPNLFKHHLHFMGNRHETKKRYVHITINLPHGEFLTDRSFHNLAKEYMAQMGYGEQPFVVVRHDDTKHEHVHIVTTTVKEDCTLVNLSHDFTRNIATQKHLEREFGLQQSPETRSKKELPVHRLPEIQPLPNDSKGVKFYIQDILNIIVQRYKVRSFDELSRLVKPYHILVSATKNKNGRVGVSYGIEVDNGYKSRFINGYIVHPDLSGPKMDLMFDRNSNSKLLPMHRKRLEKQLLITYKLFKNIKPEDVVAILKTYQKIDTQLKYDNKNAITGLTIFDKSNYVFQSSEISSDIDVNLKLAENSNRPTQIDLDNEQYVLELRKIIRTALFKQYLNSSKKNVLLSQFVLSKSVKDVLPEILNSDSFAFMESFITGNSNAILIKGIGKEYESTRNTIHLAESKKEIKVLEGKAELIKEILGNAIFDLTEKDTVLFELIQSVGAKYSNQNLSFINSKTYSIPLALGHIKLPNDTTPYISTGFIHENENMLRCILESEGVDKKTIRANAFFLPMIFPKLYEAMSPRYKMKFEQLSLEAYLKTAERFHIPFEKSAVDYLKIFNAKGFYFEMEKDEILIRSIYSKYETGLALPKKSKMYLKSIRNLDILLEGQGRQMNELRQHGRGKLQNLWASYLIEKQFYDKAAFLIVYDGVRPNLSTEVMEYHMDNGLKDKILVLSKQKINAQHGSFLRKSVYAFSSLMGKNRVLEEEVFNGFKDELTNFSRYKNVFV